MKIVTPKQMTEIDSCAINDIGIPGIVLMENAALRVVDEIIRHLDTVAGKNIYIIAGKGNNGGDAFAVARHMFNKKADVNVYVLVDKKSISGDAGTNLNSIERLGLNITYVTRQIQLEKLENDLLKAHLVVDGILGTGIKGEVKGIVRDVIEIINSSHSPVISIDIPSGVSGETGKIMGVCVKADKTVTFALPKIGIFIHPGCESAGQVVIADIGIPEKVVNGMNIKANIVDENTVSAMMPQRLSQSNKGDYGKMLIISGSVGMTGAGYLAARAALRVGAGLAYLGVPSSLTSIYDSLLPEAITIPLEDNGTGYISKQCIQQVRHHLGRMDVAAIGPGLSVHDDVVQVVKSIAAGWDKPLIIDADALNAISRDLSILKQLKTQAVLTPHPGEMARLAGISIEDVQNNRLEAAQHFAQKWNVIIVLKGSRTITATPEGKIYINTTGNAGMASGGTGDVLTGIIAGLAGQGLTLENSAVLGVYLHGVAGDLAANEKGRHGMIAGDMVEQIPYALKSIGIK